jgi:DNA-binding NarL/FixJ family response regulator
MTMQLVTSPGAAHSSVDCAAITIVTDRPGTGERLREILDSELFDCRIDILSLDEVNGFSTTEIDLLLFAVAADRMRLFETFKAARARFPRARIVAVWPSDRRREDRRALQSGVDGVIEESEVDGALVATIQAVRSGLVCFPRRASARAPKEPLSTREKQALGMLIMGFTNAEIGRRLYLAESTVKSHLSSAYVKLGVRSRKDAAALILDPNEGLGTGILAISNP